MGIRAIVFGTLEVQEVRGILGKSSGPQNGSTEITIEERLDARVQVFSTALGLP